MESCELILSLDTGASLSKGFVTVKKGEEVKTGVIQMGSNVFKTESSILESQDYIKNTKPENRAWIAQGVKKNVEAVAIGNMALKFSHTKNNVIEGVKYEYAVEKILAAIGVAVERYSLEKENIKCYINVLIPSDEIEGKQTIERNLRKSIKKFRFAGEIMKANLQQLNCYPEGTGGLFCRRRQKIEKGDARWIDRSRLIVFMLGHRNSSFLSIEQGAWGKRETVRIGYFDMLSTIKDKAIGQNMKDLEETIPRISLGDDNKILKSLVRGEKEKNQQEEIVQLEKACQLAYKLYWQRFEQWVESLLPNSLDEVLIFGGAAQMFKTQLQEYLYWVSSVYWGDSVAAEIMELFPEEFDEDKSLAYRYVDVYGIHKEKCDFDF